MADEEPAEGEAGEVRRLAPPARRAALAPRLARPVPARARWPWRRACLGMAPFHLGTLRPPRRPPVRGETEERGNPPPGPAVPGRRREADPATAAAYPSGDRRQRDPDRVLQPDEERRRRS